MNNTPEPAMPKVRVPPVKTAYQLAIELHDTMGIPSFPVLLKQDEKSKWQKQPLVKWGGTTRDTDPGEWNWRRANAVGVPMGERSGLFTFDIDDYKPGSKAVKWVQDQGLPPTRTHLTASGGSHRIYRMPADLRLGNSAPKVHGLDVRGDGGYIVWTDTMGLYTVVDDCQPADMPQKVIDLLAALNTSVGHIVHDADLPQPNYVEDKLLLPKLQAALSGTRNFDLRNRFRGGTAGLKDKSRSSMDMSVAGLLAREGFSYDEILMILLRHFEHGKAGRDGWTDPVERECCRCAWRAVSQREKSREAFMEELTVKQQQLRRFSEGRSTLWRGAAQ